MDKTKRPSKKSPARAKQTNAAKVVRNAATGRFVAAKTGRVIKLSPAIPKLGAGRIQSAVEIVVRKQQAH